MEDDLCDFTDVTLGLGRLHQVLQDVSSSSEPAAREAVGRRILRCPARASSTFGLVMVGGMFRRAGWEVEGGPSELVINPVARGRSTWFDVVGFWLLMCTWSSWQSAFAPCARPPSTAPWA